MPDDDLIVLKEITLLKKEKRTFYINLIKTLLPEYNKKDLKKLPKFKEEDLYVFPRFLEFSIKIFINFYNTGLSEEDFINDIIIPSIKSSIIEIDIDDEIKSFFINILRMDKSVGIYAKNVYLTFENLNLFFNARIISDLRYLFYSDISKLPNYALIQHTLKISYSKNREIKEKFFSFNLEQLNELKDLINRAIAKESTIKKLSKQNNLKILKGRKV